MRHSYSSRCLHHSSSKLRLASALTGVILEVPGGLPPETVAESCWPRTSTFACAPAILIPPCSEALVPPRHVQVLWRRSPVLIGSIGQTGTAVAAFARLPAAVARAFSGNVGPRADAYLEAMPTEPEVSELTRSVSRTYSAVRLKNTMTVRRWSSKHCGQERRPPARVGRRNRGLV